MGLGFHRVSWGLRLLLKPRRYSRSRNERLLGFRVYPGSKSSHDTNVAGVAGLLMSGSARSLKKEDFPRALRRYVQPYLKHSANVSPPPIKPILKHRSSMY